MFTGIITEVGSVTEVATRGSGRRLSVRCPEAAAGLAPGASVAVEGVCLTAVQVGAAFFAVDVSAETVGRTTLGELARGDYVNLELPVAAGGPLGGHYVQGHVDGVGNIVALERAGEEWLMRVYLPPALARYIVPRGPVAVAGISLTVAEAGDADFAAAIIPYTYEHTTLAFKRSGDRVNIEIDIIAKYVDRFWRQAADGLTADRLRELGYDR